MTGTLIKINGVWVTDPDPDSWSPVRHFDWAAGSGRVTTTGYFVGSRKYSKYTVPCKWVMLPVEESSQIQALIEAADFISITFRHNGGYVTITANASDYVPTGIISLNGQEYYKSATVTFAER